jgi:hypothetical protein
VALERNNTALELDPDYDPEFGQMLRRHLKHGGAPVAACTGFDADTAIAFLESALTAAARGQYESHLAGCPACRRHIIELSRLMRSVPQLAPAPHSVNGNLPVWAKWKARAAEWFDISRWSWNWQTAGLSGAAAMAVIAALAIQPWRQSQQSKSISDVAIAPAAQQNIEAGPSTGNVAAQPSPEALSGSLQDSATGEPNELIASARQTPSSQSPNLPAAPKLQATPMRQEQDAVSSFSLRTEDARLLRGRIVELPPVASAAPPQLAGQVNVAFAQPDFTPKEVADTPQPSASLVGMQVAPSPEDNPMRDAKDKPAAKKTEEGGLKQDLWKRVAAFAPRRKDDGESKISPIIRDDGEIRPLTVRIHNRVFYRENGAWVDQEYKEETMKGRVTRLVHGSPEFERVLASEPQLKPYFEKRQILIIWRDKIYKVVEK